VVALDRVRQAAVRPAVLIWALLLAGFIKGFIGLDLPTTATGPLTMVMTPGQAALVVVPKAATNIWQALTGKHLHPLRRRFCPMLLGIGIGSTPGAGFLVHDSSGRATMALGTAGWLRRRTHLQYSSCFFVGLRAIGRIRPSET